MPQLKNTTLTPIRQALTTLRDVEEQLLDAYGYAPVTASQLERVARTLVTALSDLDARLTKLERYQEASNG